MLSLVEHEKGFITSGPGIMCKALVKAPPTNVFNQQIVSRLCTTYFNTILQYYMHCFNLIIMFCSYAV